MTSLPLSLPVSPLGAAPDARAAAGLRHADAKTIDRVAGEFESVFVSLLIKQMRQTLEPGTMFGEDTSDAYGGLFDMYMGQHIARAGGFGIAELVKENMNRRADDTATRPSPQQAFAYQATA